MERMINTRLVWYLEKLKPITPVQSGFRKQRSTTEQLVRLETLFARHLSIKPHLDPQLSLNGMPIPVVEKTKFLGLIFDRKLSFIPYLHYLKEKCLKAINLLRVVAHTSWGADQQTLLHLYRSLIRSKLDYGCIVYGSARPSYLNLLGGMNLDWISVRKQYSG